MSGMVSTVAIALLLPCAAVAVFLYLALRKRTQELAAGAEEIRKLQEQVLSLSMDATRLQAEKEALQTGRAEDAAHHQQAFMEMKNAFQVLSHDALAQTLTEAKNFFSTQQKADFEHRHEAVAALLKPFAEQVKAFQTETRETVKSQIDAIATVRAGLLNLSQTSTQLSEVTARFSNILHANVARGRWGEETLRRVVEVSGMQPWCDFTEQSVGEGQDRPDMVVRLPDGYKIIIDAKSLDLTALTAADALTGAERAAKLKEHLKTLQTTITALSNKRYPQNPDFKDSLDYTVMFLPAESMLSCALEAEPALLVWAAEKKVMLATPASLLALLSAARLCWRQFEKQENVEKIAQQALELYERVCVFAQHFEGIGSALSKATEKYNAAAASFQSRVKPSGESLLKLGIQSQKALPDAEAVEVNIKGM